MLDDYLFFSTLEVEMKSNCRYGKNHSFGKNFFPSKEIYFTLSTRLRMGVESAGLADGS